MQLIADRRAARASLKTQTGADDIEERRPGRAVPVTTGRRATASLSSLALAAAGALLLAACTRPGATALGTNVPLAPAPELAGAATPGVLVWRAPDLAAHERMASSYLIPPAMVYRGKGSGFGTLSGEQVDAIAADLTRDVRAAIGRRFKVVTAPGPGVFTLQLILVKVDPPHRMYIANGPYDWSSAVIGMPDAQPVTAGEMTVSGKITDAATGKLLVGFVAPVSPQIMNMDDVSGPDAGYRFAQEASGKFASDLVAAIVRQRRIGQGETSR